MQQVWKCDFCPTTNAKASEIEYHEPQCVFNPINKKCYSCRHEYEAGYPISGHETGCNIGLDTRQGEKTGHCQGYEPKKE